MGKARAVNLEEDHVRTRARATDDRSPLGAAEGRAEIPGDKSISHRALILGAMAVGETQITGLLEGQDVLDTAKAMRAFGAEVIQHGPGAWSVHGVGVGALPSPPR